MRSDQIKKGIERAPHRALLKATGVRDEELPPGGGAGQGIEGGARTGADAGADDENAHAAKEYDKKHGEVPRDRAACPREELDA